MSDWTANIPQAARDYIANRRLDEVECLVSDLAGVAKGKAMPASKFGKQKFFHLPNSIYAQTITGDYADMARAFGGYGERVTDPAEIAPAANEIAMPASRSATCS